MGRVPNCRLPALGEVLRCHGLRHVHCSDAAVTAADAAVLPAPGDPVRFGGHVGEPAGAVPDDSHSARRARQQVQPRQGQSEALLLLLDHARFS